MNSSLITGYRKENIMKLTEVEMQFNEILEDVADSLDIPPSKYKQAVDRYSAVGNWLKDEEYEEARGEADIYPQGSFRLGTVVRPIRDGKEADYDIDLVCQLPIDKFSITAELLKQMVGNRLKDNANYRQILDKEGRRCWTLEYAEEDGIGFHVDILPSIPIDDTSLRLLNERNVAHRYFESAIEITDLDKSSIIYSWKEGGSNPKGYAQWFDDIKTCHPNYMDLSFRQKQTIFEDNRTIFASIDEIPEPLVRTPLQRAIQILKRHRDFHFKDNPNNKPISMIVTTLAALAYGNESDIYAALMNIVRRTEDYVNTGLIQKVDGQWYIPNPVNPAENFADRWDDEKANAFFEWLGELKGGSNLVLQQKGLNKASEILSTMFGYRVVESALTKNAERKRANIDKRIIKTSVKTGALSTTGKINSPRHHFHSE